MGGGAELLLEAEAVLAVFPILPLGFRVEGFLALVVVGLSVFAVARLRCTLRLAEFGVIPQGSGRVR